MRLPKLYLIVIAIVLGTGAAAVGQTCDKRFLEACRWADRSRLTAEYKELCGCLDKEYPNNIAKPVTVEGANGAIYRVDMNSIQRYSNGAVEITVYIREGDRFIQANVRIFTFDCQGQFLVRDGTSSQGPMFAPPKSIAGQIGDLACRSK